MQSGGAWSTHEAYDGSGMEAPRVYLADDHPLYREGVSRALRRAGIEIVGEAGDGSTALSDLERLAPDVALLDERMPELTGREVVVAARERGLTTRILLLSAHLEPEGVLRGMEAGAAGYLSKLAERDELTEAIQAAVRGETVISPELGSELARGVRGRLAAGQVSPRELEVLRLLAEGHSSPGIAEQLGLSTATVRSHLQNLYGKLGVSTQAAAVAEGMRRGLVT